MSILKRHHYAWTILLVCCCLSGSVAGMVVHCRGVFYAPAAQSLGVSATTYATYLTWGGLAGVVVMPWVTRLFRTLPIKKVLLAYLALFCGCEVALGFAQRMWQCYLIGACQGTVSAFLTLYPISTIIKSWFTQRRGLAIGIATMLGGVLASVMNLVVERLISLAGWRVAYVAVGAVAFLLSAIPVALFMVRTPADIGMDPYGGPQAESLTRISDGHIRWDRRFLLTFLPIVAITIACYMSGGYGQHLSNYAVGLGMSSTTGASLVSLCMLGNVGGKLVGGLLNDWLGVFRTAGLILFTISLAFFILLSSPDNLLLLSVAAVLMGQATAFMSVEIPLLVGTAYPDSQEYDTCFSTVIRIGTLTNALNNTLISVLYDRAGSYHLGHSLCAALLLACVPLVALVRRFHRTAVPKQP